MTGRSVPVAAEGKRVASNVRLLRQERGLTQVDLAKRMAAAGRYMHPDSVLRMEQGARRMDIDDLIAVAAALDIDACELLLKRVGVAVTWESR